MFFYHGRVWDEETNSKLLGHIFAIEFILDSLYEGEVPKDVKTETSQTDEPALLDLDVSNAADEYEEHLDLSPTAVSAKGAAAAACAFDAAPALPEASASASAAAASASDSAAAAPSEWHPPILSAHVTTRMQMYFKIFLSNAVVVVFLRFL